MKTKHMPLKLQFFAESSGEVILEGNEPMNNEPTNTNQNNESKQDDVKAGEQAISKMLEEMGLDSVDTLKGIVTKHKEDEEANKTELQKSNDTLIETTRKLAAETEARQIAEAKFLATTLGVKPELADDIVTIAKSKVTKEKDISSVMSEMKGDKKYSFYFVDSKEEENKNKQRNVTRQRTNKTKLNIQEGEGAHSGSMAERLLAGRKVTKSHYFSN